MSHGNRTTPVEIDAANRDADALLGGLAREMTERHAILFVGSGISAGLGLPMWEGFIGRLGADLGMEPDEFLELSRDFRSLAEF